MDFELTMEQKELQSRAKRFVDEVCTPLESVVPLNEHEAPDETMQMIRRKFAEYGLMGLTVPKEYGGQGYGCMGKCVVMQEMMKTRLLRGMLPTNGFLMEPNYVLYTAPEHIKEKYFYPILNGEHLYNLMISEPQTGSDAANIKTTAVKDGDYYIINGIKRWAPPAIGWVATPLYMLVFAVTDPTKGYKGISMFAVDYPSEGLSVIDWHETYEEGGVNGRVADWEFKNVRVPAENLLGEPGEGFKYMMSQLNFNRIVLSAGHVARAQVALEMMVARAKERVTFGKPLAARQAIQWMIAESAAEIEQAQLLVMKAATDLDAGKDVRRQAAMCKYITPELVCRVADKAIQVWGGEGLVKDNPLGRIYFQGRLAKLAEGSTEMMKQTIARTYLR